LHIFIIEIMLVVILFLYHYITLVISTHKSSIRKNDFAKVSKNLARYKSENNFVETIKIIT